MIYQGSIPPCSYRMNMVSLKTAMKIVVIGGGSGTYQVLTGLKKYSVDLSAVISMSDSGGSTGRLRQELGILPPGDVRQAILALSDLPFASKTLETMFDFRFDNGKSLSGHSLGNILLAALVQITGSMDKAIEEAARILNVSGNICPVTLGKSHLVAVLADKTRVYGETNIDMRNFKIGTRIEKVYLTPKVSVFKKAAQTIKKADVIILGPGDLYTSIIPVLLVEGVNEAITKSKGKLVYVTNLMTKRGETDGFMAQEFTRELENYLGDAGSKLSHVIVNRKINTTKSKMSAWYKRYGSIPVVDDYRGKHKYKVIKGNFVDKTDFYRHDPKKLAKVIMALK